MVGVLALDRAVASLMDLMDDYLPGPVQNLPNPTVGVASVRARPVGLGNFRGTSFIGSLGLSELKGVRVDALIRFELWSADPGEASAATTALSTKLLADAEVLRSKGVLRLTLDSRSPADDLAANGWRQTSDYRVLYEFEYLDTDGAESLIVQIPISVESEEAGSPFLETTVVTDEIVRWDDKTAPTLVVRGPFGVGSVVALVFAAGVPPTNAVTVTRTHDDAVGSPTTYGDLTSFAVDVAGPNAAQRHAAVGFSSFSAFLADPAFVSQVQPGDDPIELGDWDVDGSLDTYLPLLLRFDPPIELPTPKDRFEIAHQGVELNHVAVCYLRANKG